MFSAVAPVQHIMLDDDGIPRTIHGHVKVRMIAQKHLTAGEGVEAIATHYAISVADVYAALAYYHNNRPYFDERDSEAEALSTDAERYSSDLIDKINQRLEKR